MKIDQEKEQNKVVQNLKERFSVQNIKNQHRYIPHMNKNIEIKINVFQADQELQGLSTFELSEVLSKVPYFKLTNDRVRICYPRQNSTVILTGIQSGIVEVFVERFKQEQFGFHNYNKNTQISKIEHQEYWSRVEFKKSEGAKRFQSFVRKKKKEMDLESHFEYRKEKRRVRVVIQSEDFLTLLMDLMHEQQLKKFQNSFSQSNYKSLTYRPFNILSSEKKLLDNFDASTAEESAEKESEISENPGLKQLHIRKNKEIQSQKLFTKEDSERSEEIFTYFKPQQKETRSPKEEIKSEKQNCFHEANISTKRKLYVELEDYPQNFRFSPKKSRDLSKSEYRKKYQEKKREE